MDLPNLKILARRPSIILAGLLLIAIASFAAVNHLVTRFREQQKALARRLFRHGLNDISANNPERAVENFRGALAYDRSNDQYQLSLARALRDTGRTDEARSYLLSLWERSPEESTINLALARLAARENSQADALRYYHNATYGIWPSDGDAKRREAQFELVDFLVRDNALPQAQAELINMSPALPSDAGYHLRLGKLFSRTQDFEHALAQFQQVLRLDHENISALAGAGESSFQLGRFRAAQQYFSLAAKASPDDAASRQWLQQTDLVLQSDPYLRRISSAERERRVRIAFAQSGKRLHDCTASREINLASPSGNTDMTSLTSRWQEMKSKVSRLHRMDMETNDAVMDLVFQIEQQAALQCGAPAGLDGALLLLARNREGTEP